MINCKGGCWKKYNTDFITFSLSFNVPTVSACLYSFTIPPSQAYTSQKRQDTFTDEKRACEESLYVCTCWASDYSSLGRARLAVGGSPFSQLSVSLRAHCDSGTSGLSLHSFLSLPQRRGNDSSHQEEDKCLGSTEPHSCTAVILNL